MIMLSKFQCVTGNRKSKNLYYFVINQRQLLKHNEKYVESQICRWYHFNGRNWRGTIKPLDEGERGEWKTWLKTQHSKNKDYGIWSHHFMQIDGEKVKIVSDFIFLGSKITVDGDFSHKMKRHLFLERKVMTNLNSLLKSKDITLLTKVRIVKAMIFPVAMYWYESWTIRKAENWRIVAVKLCCWGRLLRVPWTARGSNQSILKEINLIIHWKDWCWSWSSNTLVIWCKELIHWERPWCW